VRYRAIFFALLTLVFTQAPSAQERGKSPMNVQEMTEVQPPNPKGSEPKPEDATKAILAAFDKYEVVGMTAAHGYKDLDDFILNLIRNPQLPGKINDIAVECGNSLYQPILDRYIAGDDMPLDEVRQVWRNTTQPMCSVSAFYEQLFPLVRRINQKLPPGKKLRMLAGDPPIDWAKVKSNEDYMQFMDRDVTITAVMKNEVLSKHRKALMLFGVGHLYHHSGDPLGFRSAVELYEKDYPGVTLVIAEHRGFGGETPFAKYNDEFESRMVSWPVPSLVQEMTGTWLADLLDKTYSSGNFFKIRPGGKPVPLQTKNKFSKMADAYLYLGPRDSLLKETHPAETFLNKEYMAELQRRAAIIGTGPITDQANPEKLSDRDYNPFVYDGMQQEMHFFGPNMLLPGAPPITGVPETTTPSDPRP
jgi:hypothetical protein